MVFLAFVRSIVFVALVLVAIGVKFHRVNTYTVRQVPEVFWWNWWGDQSEQKISLKVHTRATNLDEVS